MTLTRGERSDRAAGEILARLADVAEANVADALDGTDPEFLHDLRVSVRRARAVLRELDQVHDPGQRAHLRAELRWVQQVTGPVRDLDVQLLEWPELVASLPAGGAADLAPLQALLVARRVKELKALRAALRGRRFAQALTAWRELAAAWSLGGDVADRPRAAMAIEVLAADRIARVYRRMARDGRAIDDDSPAEALHDLRKRGKELRYLLELFGGLFPKAVVKPMVSSLKELQNVLGRFQDRAVQVEALRAIEPELAGASGGPAALEAIGLVIDALEADQLEARNGFSERFAQFASKAQRGIVSETFPRLSG